MNKKTAPTLVILALAAFASAPALAGRPLVVDDANTNDKGAGHVETWVTHADGTNLLSIAPAYAPIDGLEFSALVARESSTSLTVSALQAKWRITPSQEAGCNFGAVLGASHASLSGAGSANTTYLNGLMTCNLGGSGSVHFNLGATKPSGSSAENAWGMAYEHQFGAVTPHIEWFGSEGVKPTVQVGLRGEITKGIQLDGSIGRSEGVTISTLGLKFQF
jgi:hypothetical protein